MRAHTESQTLKSSSQEIDKLAWLFVHDKRLLAARSKGKSLLYVPGGKREPGESDAAALVREIREELSVELIAETIEPAGVFVAQADGKPAGVLVRVTCYRADFRGTINDIAAAAEIEEVVWITSADRARCSVAGQLILDDLKAKGDIA
jgi:8-oxo-dGTP pyrophosphatase MutT (NUDIX family)